MNNTLTWVHLSDIHSKSSADDWDAERILQRLLEDIPEYCESQGLLPDFVFFTGDAAWGNDSRVKATIDEQFDATFSFIERIRKAFVPVIPHAHVYFVPGNHDIDRSLVSKLTNDSLPREALGQLANWCQRNTLEWKECMRRLTNYYEFLRRHSYSHLLTNPNHLYYAHTIKIRNVSVGIAGFNSAWSSYGGDEDYGNIRLLGHLQNEILNPMVRDADVKIGLIHHPFDWYRDQAERELNRNVAADYNFLLHGHEHSQWVLPSAPEQSGHTFTKIACGSCYQGSTRPNSYNIVHIDLSSGRGEVHLRTYSSAGRGGWVPMAVPSSANDGKWPIPCPKITAGAGNEGTGDSGGDTSGTANLHLGSQAVAQMDRPLTRTISYDRLESVPRMHLPQCPEHAATRVALRDRFREVAARWHLVWLVYDWRYAHEAFLAEALHNIDGLNYTTDVFRIQCGDNATCEDMVSSAEKQIGMAFQEFLAAIAGTQNTVVFFEDVHRDLLAGSQRAAFEQHIKDVQKFCPGVLIIVGTRLAPHGALNNLVEIQPLDQNDVLSYVSNHPEGRKHSFSEETLRRLCDWSGGLPFHIDNAIAQLPYATEDQIFDDPLTDAEYATHDGAPVSLKIAVESLVNSTTKQSIASLLLLKVLTVLRDGETFDSIKRFDRPPFRAANVLELQTLRLLTVVPITKTAFSLVSSFTHDQTESSILLVPRQVRDYVNSLLLPEEIASIRHKATDLLFGKKWREGKLQSRRSLKLAYAESAIPGPGSEHVVALSLLQAAIADNDSRKISRFADLCCRYCNTLLVEDRFRDCYIASYATYRQLKDSKLVADFVDISHTLAKSLRMLDREDEAIPIVTEALRLGDKFLIPDNKGSMHLTLALCYQGRNTELAVKHAKEVLDLMHKDSSSALQANAVIANVSLKGTARVARLTELEDQARNYKHMNTANNIALELANHSRDVTESLKLIDRVLLSTRDNYNRVRAVIDKAQIVTRHRRYGELSEDERKLLNAAYSYCYSQSIGKLLNRCHKLLWAVFVKERLWAPLVRLFRFSSFNWRLLGRTSEDMPYLMQIRELNVAGQLESDPAVEMELVYVKGRIASLLQDNQEAGGKFTPSGDEWTH